MTIFWHSKADKPECESCQGAWTIRPPMDAIHQMFESMHQSSPEDEADDVSWPFGTIWNQRLLAKAGSITCIFHQNAPLLRIYSWFERLEGLHQHPMDCMRSILLACSISLWFHLKKIIWTPQGLIISALLSIAIKVCPYLEINDHILAFQSW